MPCPFGDRVVSRRARHAVPLHANAESQSLSRGSSTTCTLHGTICAGRYTVEESLKRIPAVFYRSSGGSEPVREWLKSLPVEGRRILGYDIGLVEFGWPVGMPPCRSLGGGLWEVQSSLTSGRIARVIFCIAEGR